MACVLGAHFRIAKLVAHSVLTVRLVGGHGTGSKEINNKSLCEKWTKSSALKKKDQTGVNYLQRMSNQYFVFEQTQKYQDINLSQFLSACSTDWCSQGPGQPLRAYMPVHTAAHSSHTKSELWSSYKRSHCFLGSRWSRSLRFLDLGPSLLWCHCFCNSSLQSHQWVGRWLRRGRDR